MFKLTILPKSSNLQWVRFSGRTSVFREDVSLFKLKLEGQLHNLKWLANRKPSRKESLEKDQLSMTRMAAEFGKHTDKRPEEARDHLIGIEGSIARMYWQAIATCMPGTLLFEGRSRQPAKDYFNALLNYVYGMLYPVVEGAAFAAGLDPHLGVLHADQYNQSTLTFDLIEPFRAWIDRMLLEACLQGTLDDPSFYRAKDKGVLLDKAGKRVVIPLFNDYMEQVKQYNGKRLSRKNHIYRFVQLFANQLKDFDPNLNEVKSRTEDRETQFERSETPHRKSGNSKHKT